MEYVFILYGLYSIYDVIYGGYPLVSALHVLLVIFFFVVGKNVFLVRKFEVNGFSKILGLYFVVVFVAVAIHALSFSGLVDSYGRSLLVYDFSIVFFSIVWLVVGYGFGSGHVKVSRNSAWLIMFFLALMLFSRLDDGVVINWWQVAYDKGSSDELSHLSIGVPLVLLLFLVINALSGMEKGGAVVMSLALLFVSGGRLSVIVFAFTVLFVYRNYLFGWLGASLLIAFFAGSAGLQYLGFDFNDPLVLRMFFGDGVAEDESAIERGRILSESYGLLPEQFFWGGPDLIIEKFGSLGYYIHNILSAWQFFGFLPFFFLGLAIFFLGWRINKIEDKSQVLDFSYLRCIYFYSVISVAVGKSFGFELLWFTFGYAQSVLYKFKTRA